MADQQKKPEPEMVLSYPKLAAFSLIILAVVIPIYIAVLQITFAHIAAYNVKVEARAVAEVNQTKAAPCPQR